MSMLDGVSQCWPLAKDCHLWWDAWAAVGAFLGVAATVFLGVFTYRLGRAANRAAQAAVEIAGTELDRQRLRDNKERVLVLVQIAGEVSINLNKAQQIAARIETPEFRDGFLTHVSFRQWLLQEQGKITFPVVRDVSDRLHYLEPVHAGRLVRAMGTLTSFQEVSPNEEDFGQLEFGLRILRLTFPKIVEDLGVVWTASQAAIRELGIEDHEFARSILDSAPH